MLFRSRERLRIARIGGKHEPGRGDGEHVAELFEVTAYQRIGRRDGGKGHAGQQAAKRQERMLEAVFRQDGHRTFDVQATLDQGLSDGARVLPGLAECDGLPVARAAIVEPCPSRQKRVVVVT